MKKVFINLVMFVTLCSCSQKSQIGDNMALHIVDINNPVIVSIDDFITDIDTIRLEVTDEALLTDVTIMRIMDDKFYILTNNNSCIFIFDTTGKYLSQINDRGQGPLEYIEITGFEVDPVNKEIILTDLPSKKILIYDKDGKQIKVIKLDFRPNRIVAFKNGFINIHLGIKKFYTKLEMDDYNLHFLDSTGKFVSSAIECETKKTIFVYSDHQINCLDNGDILFHPILGNIIYKITNDSIIPYYAFKNNSSRYKLMTKKDIAEFEYELGRITNTAKEKESEGYLLSRGSIIELTDYTFFGFSGWNKKRYLYYSKETSKTILIETESVKGDKNLIDIFIGTPDAANGNKMYISPTRYSSTEDLSKNMKNEKIRKYLENTDEDSNPLLFSFSIKFPK